MQAEWIEGHAIVPEWPITAGRQRVVCADHADARIAHLEGQRDVLTGLLLSALPHLQDIETTWPDVEAELNSFCERITAALAAIAAEKAGGTA